MVAQHTAAHAPLTTHLLTPFRNLGQVASLVTKVFQSSMPALENLYSPEPMEEVCSSRAFSTKTQTMAEVKSQPKRGCRMQQQQDSPHKLVLMVEITLWRSK